MLLARGFTPKFSIIIILLGVAVIVWGAETFAENLGAATVQLRVSMFALSLLLAGAEPEELATAVAAPLGVVASGFVWNGSVGRTEGGVLVAFYLLYISVIWLWERQPPVLGETQELEEALEELAAMPNQSIQRPVGRELLKRNSIFSTDIFKFYPN